jgi:hypothetical protein
MSTTIYDGCEIMGHTLESFLPLVRGLRETLVEAAAAIQRGFLVRQATDCFDRSQLNMLGESGERITDCLAHARRVLTARKEVVLNTRRRDRGVDFAFEVVLFPVEGRLLAIPFVEHPVLMAIWKSQPWVREFGYWTSADALDTVSESDWDERGRVWDVALSDGELSPAQAGYTITVVGELDTLLMEYEIDDGTLAMHIPSLEKRVDAVAMDFHLLWAHEGQPPVTGVNELIDLKASDAVAKTKTLLMGRMVPELSVAMLRGEA